MKPHTTQIRALGSLLLLATSTPALRAAEPPGKAAAEPAALNLYVTPEGKDSWSGKTPKPGNGDGPLASLAGARDAIRKLRAAGSLKAPIRVIVADGTYRITEPLRLGLEDSGTREAPVSFEAAPGARPLISGGVRITGFQPAAEKDLWQAKIPAVAGGKWYFEQLWVNGQRATRARTPNKFQRLRQRVVLRPAQGRGPHLQYRPVRRAP